MQIFLFSPVIIIRLNRIERAGEWVLNHNFRSIHSGCNLSTEFMILFLFTPLKRVHNMLDCRLSVSRCFLSFNSVISLHSHNQFSTVQNTGTHPSIWHHFENVSVISNLNRTDRFLLFLFNCCFFFSFDIVLPLYCSHVHVILREGGVELPRPKFATRRQKNDAY